MNTDEYTIYEGIAEGTPEIHEHYVINHGNHEWVNGDIHVNDCENRNGFIRGYLRRCHGASKNHLRAYLDYLALLLNERGQ